MTDNAGIVSMECYFPNLYVSQDEFEAYNNVSKGKYTIGLGQKEMAFVTDREDICSISLTVLSRLMEKNMKAGIINNYDDIGWICVATETIMDHSKSISSMLMQLFESNGNTSIEGIDVKHACYAGTFALFSAFDRVSSKYWDGRYCIVIAGDIAEYEAGPARCTGGCGAVAMLIGKNGCIELENIRSSFKAHEYDFYKPNLNSPYPVVDGKVSNVCYMNALDSCYAGYYKQLKKEMEKKKPKNASYGGTQKLKSQNVRNVRSGDISDLDTDSNVMTLADRMDYWIFHAPYNKLVQKSFGRVAYNDFLQNKQYFYEKYKNDAPTMQFLQKYESIPTAKTMDEPAVLKQFAKLSKPSYNAKVEPSTYIPQRIGNCYTASIFVGLMSLVNQYRNDIESQLAGKRIAIFSYGSGTVASLYTLKVNPTSHSLRLLNQICTHNDIEGMLKQRTKVDPKRFTKILSKRDALHVIEKIENEVVPSSSVRKSLANDAFYLTKIDAAKQRYYQKKSAVPTQPKMQSSISNTNSCADKRNDNVIVCKKQLKARL
eukprot:CAMPEP_0202699642 /NCGR_PEP_ID=MMETSP1385-20130828/12860_1 /ASSEMBLY_ACC=CAM_ASM_000861 /TAXON_ID=933848 /ORGANISM="Elphidium margaritaceum" /LENGTH=543 /DNA_ID=CAMNT_0049356627 /DNA_START=155 /DNA_END=1786 /DNA_ORIENTATION=-